MTHTARDVLPEDVIEGEIIAVETSQPASQPSGQLSQTLTFYTAGESLPDHDQERGARAQTGALVPQHQPTIEDILRAFRAWMRLDVADGKASKDTLRVYFMDVRQYLAWNNPVFS